MAAKQLPVKVQQSAGGDVAIGTTIDGVFVPFATVTGPQVSFIVQKAKALKTPPVTEDEDGE